MKKEEALKILGKSKPGKKIIAAWKAGKVALSKLVYYAKNPPKIRLFDDPRLMTKTGKEIEDMEKKEKKLKSTRSLAKSLQKTAYGYKKGHQKSVGGNGGIEVQRRKKTITEKVTKGMPKEHAKEVARHIKTSKGLALGTGAVAIAGGSYEKGRMDGPRLTKKITKDAKKREAYAKAKTKSKKYKSKSHMYPPPKPKRPKSKSHMYPPPKRKKRSGV